MYIQFRLAQNSICDVPSRMSLMRNSENVCMCIANGKGFGIGFHCPIDALSRKLPQETRQNYEELQSLQPGVLTGTQSKDFPNKLFTSYQRIGPGPRLCRLLRNVIIFYGEELLAPRQTSKMEDHPLSAVRDCLFTAFAATLRNWRPFLHLQPEDAPCRGDRECLLSFGAESLVFQVATQKQKYYCTENYNFT
jgi:hypothetical protein